MNKLLEAQMLVKHLDIKTLVSGDKSARLTLETLSPQDTEQIAKLHDKTEVRVVIYE